MVSVPVFLGSAAAAALVNGWLIARTGSLRRKLKISVGDGGNEALLRRMRAQGNFLETAPFFLLLVLGLELFGANRVGLGAAAALFILARISHGIGMEGGDKARWRMYGMMGTTLPTAVLIVWAAAKLVELGLGR